VDLLDCSVRLAPSAGGVARSIDLALLHLQQSNLFSSLPPPTGATNLPRFEVASQPSQRRSPSGLCSAVERGPAHPPPAAARQALYSQCLVSLPLYSVLGLYYNSFSISFGLFHQCIMDSIYICNSI
jgi:hypothetical protein